MTDALREQFDDLRQQRTASELGMWVFLATEVLFFGGLFVGYAVYRTMYPAAFAEAASHTDAVLGTLNTAILLTSSLFAALAVREGKAGAIGAARAFLLVTIALGLLFLGVKGYEYWKDVEEGLWIGPAFALPDPRAQIFFSFYWVMTFVHALHVTIGVGVFIAVYPLMDRRRHDPAATDIVEVPALYWHFVDVVWIFLYPILYLVGRAT